MIAKQETKSELFAVEFQEKYTNFFVMETPLVRPMLSNKNYYFQKASVYKRVVVLVYLLTRRLDFRQVNRILRRLNINDKISYKVID